MLYLALDAKGKKPKQSSNLKLKNKESIIETNLPSLQFYAL